MSYLKKLKAKRTRRKLRVKNSFQSRGVKLRVSVFRSLKQIYAQIIDDSAHATLASYSSILIKDKKGDKKAIAKQVGIELGNIAKSKSINEVYFDRGRYAYLGRLAALAEGLRESGLKF